MKNIGIQEYLSFGYLYLLVLGIITDTIFYNLIGIKILNYSNISDILLTPINLLTSNLILLFALLLMLGISYYFVHYIQPKLQKLKPDQPTTANSSTQWITLTAVLFICLFLGLGIGRGSAVNALIAEGKLETSKLITFSNSKTVEVRIVGQNTAFIFYVPKNGRSVVVSPISSVLQIQELKK
jgi:uncharacterized membrane protein